MRMAKTQYYGLSDLHSAPGNFTGPNKQAIEWTILIGLALIVKSMNLEI